MFPCQLSEFSKDQDRFNKYFSRRIVLRSKGDEHETGITQQHRVPQFAHPRTTARRGGVACLALNSILRPPFATIPRLSAGGTDSLHPRTKSRIARRPVVSQLEQSYLIKSSRGHRFLPHHRSPSSPRILPSPPPSPTLCCKRCD